MKSEILELLEEYMDNNPDMSFTMCLESIRQRIGARLVDVKDEQVLTVLRQWETQRESNNQHMSMD